MSKRALPALLATLAVTGLALASGALAAASPAVSSGMATSVTDTTAVVSGSVNPNGEPTTYAFEYGTTTNYTQQTAADSAGAGTSAVTVNTELKGLTPGTTYHFRLLAINASGTIAGNDVTFKTTGIAPPAGPTLGVATGAASNIEVDGAKLSGTINPATARAGEMVRYYFQLGPTTLYDLQTPTQTVTANKAPIPASATVGGLASATQFHYRLVAVNETGHVSVGADQTFTTQAEGRLLPVAVQMSARPKFQRRLPDRVTVSGRMIPPSSLSKTLACHSGFFDITFRVGQVVIQVLRAGIRPDCTFSLPVDFHERSRLKGGHVVVHVLFAGNRFLHRLEAPPQAIQIG